MEDNKNGEQEKKLVTLDKIQKKTENILKKALLYSIENAKEENEE